MARPKKYVETPPETKKLIVREMSLRTEATFRNASAGEFRVLKDVQKLILETESNFIKNFIKIKKISKKINQPHFRGTSELTLSNLHSIQQLLKTTVSSSKQSMDLYQDFFTKPISDRHGKLLSEHKSNTAKELELLYDHYGSYERLHEAFQQNPDLVPYGINKNISKNAIRLRIYRKYKS